MDKSKSKYFETAKRMDEAFLSLINKKDLSYITVKEICEKAKVNRSTFYLHYETINDLLLESTQYIIDEYEKSMPEDTKEFVKDIENCSLDDLYLITPKYLVPYLTYIKQNRRIFLISINNFHNLQMSIFYAQLDDKVFEPILKRYEVDPDYKKYIIPYFVDGIMAIIRQWLSDDCNDSIEHVVSVIQSCIKQR